MIKNLLQLTILSYGWKKYKHIIISTGILFSYFWLVETLHDDYVSYSQLNNDTNNLGLSFILKWLFYISGCFLYYFINTKPLKKEGVSSPSSAPKRNTDASSKNKTEKNQQANTEDPFKRIREKDKLRSLADVLIDKHDTK